MSNTRDIQLFIEDAQQELYADPVDPTGASRNALDSVDDQIDSYLIKFESDSVVEEEDLVLESLRQMSLSILLEQDDPAEPGEGDEGAGEAQPAPAATDDDSPTEPTGSERQKSDEPADPPKLPLDIDEFTKRVARLANNSETLLDVQAVVINRAFNYLLEHYDVAHVDAMREILDEQFDFNIDDPGEPLEAPFAVGAYAGGTGGLGGGG